MAGVSTADNYEFACGNVVKDGTDATMTFDGLKANTTYVVKARARYSGEDGLDHYTPWVSKTITTLSA